MQKNFVVSAWVYLVSYGKNSLRSYQVSLTYTFHPEKYIFSRRSLSTSIREIFFAVSPSVWLVMVELRRSLSTTTNLHRKTLGRISLPIFLTGVPIFLRFKISIFFFFINVSRFLWLTLEVDSHRNCRFFLLGSRMHYGNQQAEEWVNCTGKKKWRRFEDDRKVWI